MLYYLMLLIISSWYHTPVQTKAGCFKNKKGQILHVSCNCDCSKHQQYKNHVCSGCHHKSIPTSFEVKTKKQTS
ncbi:hypothetical protein EBR77_00425 [bacterium]|nr:hypothetical protein [bacterium]NBX78351.1 hypothetical protein [bacterium]